MLNDALKLLVDKFHTAHSRLLQAPDLTLHQQLKRHFWHEQSRPWTLYKPKTRIGSNYTTCWRFYQQF